MSNSSYLKRLLSASVAMVATVGLLGTAPAQAEKIVISNWDGYMPADLLENFTKATGYEAELALHATNEEIMGKVTASGGKGYDVIFVSSPFVEALDALGLSATLDHDKIPNLSNLYPEASKLSYDMGNNISVPYTWGTTGLCYRSDMVEGTPDSWDDLLKPSDALKGKITMLSTDRWLMGAGALALGYSINETESSKIENIKNTLIAAKKNLLAYDDATFYAKLVSGEASLVHAWDGWCNYGIAENTDIKYIIPKEGTDLFVDAMVVMETSSNKDAAHAFLNYVLNAEIGNWVVSNILYKSPNRAAMDTLDPSIIEAFPNVGMKPADMLKYETMRDLGSAQKAYTRAVTEILASQ
jgi:spermidine/putrescine transport system substrate-binding protein